MAGRVVNGVKLSLTLHDYSSYLGNDISETHLIDVLTMSQRRKSITLENDSQNSSPTRPIRRKSVSGSDSRRRKSIAGKSSPTHPALSPTAESHNEELHIDKKSVYGVVLREFVEKSQILDSDERDDILLEINRILIYNSPASTTTSSASQPLFPTKDNIEGSHDITFWQSFDISSVAVLSSDKTAIDEDNNLLDVLVTFPSLEACCVAMARLRGMVVAGTQITADVVSVPIKASHWNKSMPIGRQLPCLIIHRSEARGAVVVIKGYLPNSMSITDEVILSYKKEFLDAFMNQLLLDSSDKIDGFNNFDTCITRITSHMGRMDNNHSVPQTKDSAIVACVGFSAPQEALNVMLNLEGAIMGGQQVRLYISYASLIEELSGDIQDTDDQKFAVPAGDVRKRGSTGSLVAKLDLSRGSVSPLSVASTSGRSSAAGDITQRNRTVFRPDSEAIKLMALNRSPTPRRVESDDRSESSMEPDQITKKRTQKKRGGKFQSSSAAPSPLVTSSYLPSSAVVSSPASPESAISSGTVSVYKEAKQAPKLSKHSRAPANIPNENEEKHAGYYVGQKALLNPGVRHPYENGVIESWEDMEAIWEHCFTDCLRVDTSTTRVFLTEAHMPSRVTRETTIETMFELFDVEATYLHVQPVLALFAAGLTSGCVIDSGEYSTTVYPVADGYHLVNASVRLSLGGCDISDILESLLLNSGRFSDEVQNILSNTVADIIRNIKEKHCYVNEFHQTEYSRASVKYTLPDGTVIDVGQDGALSQCTERFFNPLKFANICDSDEDSLPAAIIKSIMTAGLDLRRSLVNSIVLSGGNTMFRGLEGRLANELKSLMPGTMSSSLRILAPSDRSNSVWNGGSILTSLSTFEDQWITKADYDEIGSDIVHQKCSVYL
ncbi:unnamed protein product [Sphagnum balticum]